MKKNSGFTLIELVIVIIILGILAAKAIPTFNNLSSDARIASLESLKGALTEGANLVYNKAVIKEVDSGNDYLDVDGNGSDDISIRSGYPRVANSCSKFVSGLTYWMSFPIEISCDSDSDADWYGSTTANAFYFIPSGYSGTSDNCYVTYTTASEKIDGKWVDSDSATVTITTDGCSN